MGNKRVIISVTNDLVGDQRVHKVASSLMKFGYDILLVGRMLKVSRSVSRDYKTKRIRLIFKKTALFYAEYNLRLFFLLLFRKVDILLSNDLDTLPANYLISKLRKKTLVYDSHEYFTEVPELVNRPKVKRVWQKIEKRIVPKIIFAYTVCNSIADIYNDLYGIDMKVVRNVPVCNRNERNLSINLRDKFPGKKIILYQGSVNTGRGLEEMIDAMRFVNNAVFIIIGAGDIKEVLRDKVDRSDLNEKVFLLGKVPFEDLHAYTRAADIGISIEKNIGLNYYYSLPNKLFDYIHAGIPVLASKLPEIERIMDMYDVGVFIEDHDPQHIAEKVSYMLKSDEEYKNWKRNTIKASKELCWEKEEEILQEIFALADK